MLLTWPIIRTQMTNGTSYGQMAQSKSISSIEWSLISVSTISQECTHLLERIIWPGTSSVCKICTLRITNSFHKHGSCQQNSVNSRNNSVIRREREGNQIEKRLSLNQKRQLREEEFSWLGAWRTLTPMSTMSFRDTYISHSWLTNWSLIFGFTSCWAASTRFAYFSIKKDYADWQHVNTAHLIKITWTIYTCTWRITLLISSPATIFRTKVVRKTI